VNRHGNLFETTTQEEQFQKQQPMKECTRDPVAMPSFDKPMLKKNGTVYSAICNPTLVW